MTKLSVNEFRNEIISNMTDNILPYWMNKMVDEENGGFYGRRDANDNLVADAPKGAILNGRLLWSFAAAYRMTKRPEYLEMANRAKRYIRSLCHTASLLGSSVARRFLLSSLWRKHIRHAR